MIINEREKNMAKNDIEKKVDNIISMYSLGIPGFDLAHFLTDKMGFQIGLQNMEDNTTGILLINDEDFIPNTQTHKLIAINAMLQRSPDFRQRKRFITAHEYAHYILHKPAGHLQYAHRDTDKKDTAQEREADFFARCLLMPRNLVNEFLSMGSMKNLSLDEKAMLIARVFNVTFKKAYQRLKEDLNYV